MAIRKAASTADKAAGRITRAGRAAGSQAKRAGAQLGDAVEETAERGAASIRRGARRAARAYDDAAYDVEARTQSIEDTIRDNPIAAAGAALLIGVVLGRFIL